MRNRACVYSALVAAVAVMFVSCGDSPSGPATPAQIQLSAPSEIEPGEVVQMRLLLRKGDRAIEDVSDRAQWFSSNPEVIAVTPTGLATGSQRGESNISVSFEGRSATQRVLVLPKGTFRLGGVIRESNIPVEGVTVTVLSGDSTGLTTVSSANGTYALYGVIGHVRIGLAKSGFLSAEHELDVAGHLQHDFSMAVDGPPRNLSGRYTLTIFASGSCPSSFPQGAARRTYRADVTQENNSLQVMLSDAPFIVHTTWWGGQYGDRFWGYVNQPTSSTVYLYIGTDYYYYYSSPGTYGIAERFGDAAVLIKGTAVGSGTTSRIEGTMSGSIYVGAATTPPFEPITAQCSNLRFEMTRN